MQTYWIYKKRNIPYTAFNWVYLNWFYTLSFFLSYQEYQNPLLNSLKDMIISEDRLKTEYNFFIAEHTMTDDEISNFITTIPSEFDVQLKTNEEALEWIRNNTNLQEVSPWKFLIQEEYNFNWEIIEAKFLTIE